MDNRYQALCQWLADVLQVEDVELSVVSGDASFRRYFRFTQGENSWIAMDAPPEKEDCSSFVHIARHWFEQGIRVPEIVALDLEKGFILLTDFGDSLLLSALQPEYPNPAQGQHYYSKAMFVLDRIQKLDADQANLPRYDAELLQREMALFRDWLLDAKLGIALTHTESQALQDCFDFLMQRAQAQPQVVVHRDYHARNLMICEDDELGVLDFQDAVIGPITYDLVSLLRDCYIVWPEEDVQLWCREFYSLITQYRGKIGSFEQFKEDFDLMGLQRHIKVAGIFARLSLRDGKHAYLKDIPRTLNYIIKVANSLLTQSPERFAAIKPLLTLIEQQVLPLTGLPEFFQAGSLKVIS
jgi:aminoglycoside/choline kinase family phosphotransferase